MVDVLQLSRDEHPRAQLGSYPPIARGYILAAAASFAEGVNVILPYAGTDRHYGPCPWPAIHGSSLPAEGAACVVTFDDSNVPTIVWWEGPQAFPSIARGTSLPGTPADGQEYDYVADATNGVIWRLRYRTASLSPHKWEFVGGGAMSATAAGEVSTESSAYVVLTGPSFTLPRPGEYEIGFTACLYNSFPETASFVSVKLGSAAAGEGEEALAVTKEAHYTNTVSRAMVRTMSEAGTLSMAYRTEVAAKTAFFHHRDLWARPVRVA